MQTLIIADALAISAGCLILSSCVIRSKIKEADKTMYHQKMECIVSILSGLCVSVAVLFTISYAALMQLPYPFDIAFSVLNAVALSPVTVESFDRRPTRPHFLALAGVVAVACWSTVYTCLAWPLPYKWMGRQQLDVWVPRAMSVARTIAWYTVTIRQIWLRNTDKFEVSGAYNMIGSVNNGEVQESKSACSNSGISSSWCWMPFAWARPMIRAAQQGNLVMQQLPSLPEAIEVVYTSKLMLKAVAESQRNRAQQAKLWMILLMHCGGTRWVLLGVLKFFIDVAALSSPVILKFMLDALSDRSTDIWTLILLGTALPFSTLLQGAGGSYYSYWIECVKVRVRGSIPQLVLSAAMKVPRHPDRRTPRSTQTDNSEDSNYLNLSNLCSVDANRIADAFGSVHELWSLPFQVTVALYLLYKELGIASLAAVGFFVVVLPLNMTIAKIIGWTTVHVSKHRDARVATSSNGLSSVSAMISANLTGFITSKILGHRRNEFKYLSFRKFADAFCVLMWDSAPNCLIIVCLAARVWRDGSCISSGSVYAVVSLLGILKYPLNAFPWVINGVMEAKVSVQRISQFLSSQNLCNPGSKFMLGPNEDEVNDPKESIIQCKHARVTLADGKIIDDVNFSAEAGKLVIVVGGAGSGKTSLLKYMASIGCSGAETLVSAAEIKNWSAQFSSNEKDVRVFPCPLLVTDPTWLFDETVLSNIMFHQEDSLQNIHSLFERCALGADVVSWRQGISQRCGSLGCNLSGGQRRRVSIARALAQVNPSNQPQAPLLLDCPLVGLDGESRAILAETILKESLNRAIVMVAVSKEEIQACLHAATCINATAGNQSMAHVSLLNLGQDHALGDGDSAKTAISLTNESDIGLTLGSHRQAIDKQDADSSGDWQSEDVSPKQKSSKDSDEDYEEESMESGLISWKVIQVYLRHAGWASFTFMMLGFLIMQLTRVWFQLALVHWTSYGSNHPSIESLRPVSISVVANVAASVIRAVSFAIFGLVAANRMHQAILNSVMGASYQVLSAIPLGRLINRLSSDTDSVDESLPFQLNILGSVTWFILSSLALMGISYPWILLVFALVAVFYYHLQHVYRYASRTLRRLESISRSPVFTHIQDIEAGLDTVRCMPRAQTYMMLKLEESVDEMLKCQHAQAAAAQWFGFRLQLIVTMLFAVLAALAVCEHQGCIPTFDRDPQLLAAFLGLALSQAVPLAGFLTGFVQSLAETERQFIAVERQCEYMNLTPEQGFGKAGDSCNKSECAFQHVSPLPLQELAAAIEVENLTVRHANNQLAFSGITFSVQQGTHTVIAGRSGSGKSSLALAVCKMIPANSGSIRVLGKNIHTYNTGYYRRQVTSLLTQDPWIFDGTVHENVDPFGRLTQQEIIQVLEKTGAWTVCREDGTDTLICENGQCNLSRGEMQLVCVARLVAAGVPIVINDEATSHLNDQAEHRVLSVLQSLVADGRITLLSIAHKGNVLKTADQIVKM